MPQYLSPIGNDQFIDSNGDPLVGGRIETYLAGSSTPAATYTDDSGSTPQSNPIILDSLGKPTLGPIWLTGGVSYKFIIKNAAGSTLWTMDNIAGINDATLSQSEWLESGFVPTYINGTSFSVPGDQTGTLQVNRRLRTTNTSGFIYSTITNSVFSAGNTTVTLANDSGTLDAGLSAVAYGLLSATNSSIPIIQTAGLADKSVTMAKIQDIASGTLLGRVDPGSGVPAPLTPSQIPPLLTSKIQPFTVTVNGVGGAPANGMRVTINPTTLDFRSATPGSGAVDTVAITSPIIIDVPTTALLGMTNGVLARFVVGVMNNGGAGEGFVNNLLGGLNFDESGLLTTTVLNTASDLATVAYSPTARSNLPYRLLGYFEITEATAGVYVTAPSIVNGSSSPLAMWLAGYGQTIQSMGLALNTNHTNNTGRSITAFVTINAGGPASASALIDGNTVLTTNVLTNLNAIFTLPVRAGEVYRFNGSTGLLSWWERR